MSYRFQAGLEELHDRWGWYFALGLALVVLGVAASSWAYLTTVASVFVFGWFLLFAGVTLGILSGFSCRFPPVYSLRLQAFYCYVRRWRELPPSRLSSRPFCCSAVSFVSAHPLRCGFRNGAGRSQVDWFRWLLARS